MNTNVISNINGEMESSSIYDVSYLRCNYYIYKILHMEKQKNSI